jgi:crossover junction endodeoxyribonuclease RuvC
MIIIGIDPGTSCGWSVLKDGKRISSGTWDLSSKRHEGGGMRYLRAQQFFKQLVIMLQETDKVTAVAYEEVRRHMGVDAAHIYGGIVGVITAVCEDLQIPFQAIPVGSAKKLATNKGNASKTEMIAAANNRWGLALQDEEENEADALWMAATLYEDLKT